MYQCVDDKIVDVTVWIANDRAKEDPTVEFVEGDCDLTITNHGSMFEYYRKLDKLCALLGIRPLQGK